MKSEILNEINKVENQQIPLLLKQQSFNSPDQLQQFQRQKQMLEDASKLGKQLLIDKNYQQASKQLSKALMAFQFIMKNHGPKLPKQEIKNIMIESIFPTYNNLALAHLKLRNYELVLSFTNQILAQHPDNVKARYRRGLANKQLKNIAEAIGDFQMVRKIDSEMENDCLLNIKQCKAIQNQLKLKRKQMASRFLKGYQSPQTVLVPNQTKQQQNQKAQEQQEFLKKYMDSDKKKNRIINWVKDSCQGCIRFFRKIKNGQKKSQ